AAAYSHLRNSARGPLPADPIFPGVIMTRRCVTRAALMISGVAWSVVAAGQAPPVAYEVAFEGVSDPELVEALRSVSQAVALQERPPISPRLLRRRAENDIDRLREALRSRGYYAATVRL